MIYFQNPNSISSSPLGGQGLKDCFCSEKSTVQFKQRQIQCIADYSTLFVASSLVSAGFCCFELSKTFFSEK